MTPFRWGFESIISVNDSHKSVSSVKATALSLFECVPSFSASLALISNKSKINPLSAARTGCYFFKWGSTSIIKDKKSYLDEHILRMLYVYTSLNRFLE